ncbi:protein [Escherichia coli]|uniref:Protein n=1 Tax=Escherichia coli TaxID=562 RepID=A0A2X1P2F8_ECOLX|nr:protein [Escherichia coli]
MQIVELKTEGVGLHGVARLTFNVESENIFW